MLPKLCRHHGLGRARAAWMCSGCFALGAVTMYLMDLERGRRRRHMLRDRIQARLRRLARSFNGIWREAAAGTYGVSHRIVHLVPKATEIADDETLRQRVESQLFRDPHVPKGDLNITCEHGMVILRGELDALSDIRTIEERVRHVSGVRGVQNLLHARGTPAPNKERSRLAGR